jgi:hypothetical protein
LAQELLTTDLPRFEQDLQGILKDQQVRPPAVRALQSSPATPVAKAIGAGMQKYSHLSIPILAIFAVPHNDFDGLLAKDPEGLAAFEARDEETTEAQATAFEIANPSAHVVRLAHANHDLYLSNVADVLREMNAFISTLPL